MKQLQCPPQTTGDDLRTALIRRILQLFSEPAYAAAHAPTGVTPEFAAMRDHLFAEMLWWQMSALRQGLGMEDAKQAKQFQRTHGAFLRFEKGLRAARI